MMVLKQTKTFQTSSISISWEYNSAHQAQHQSLFGGEKSLGDGLLPWLFHGSGKVYFEGLWTFYFFRFILGWRRI